MNMRVAVYLVGLCELVCSAYLLSGQEFAIALTIGYLMVFGAGFRTPRGPLLFPSYRSSFVVRAVFGLIYGVLILAGSPLLRRLVFVVIGAASGLDWLPRPGGRGEPAGDAADAADGGAKPQ